MIRVVGRGHLGRHVEALAPPGLEGTFFLGQAPGWGTASFEELAEGNALRAARALREVPEGGWFCYASTGSVYSPTETPYIRSKRLGEDVCRANATLAGVRLLVVRPFGLYGPGSLGRPSGSLLGRFRGTLEAEQRVRVTHARLAHTYVLDAALALLEACAMGLTGTYDLLPPPPLPPGYHPPPLSWVVMTLATGLGRLDLVDFDDAPQPLGLVPPTSNLFTATGVAAQGIEGGLEAWLRAEPPAPKVPQEKNI